MVVNASTVYPKKYAYGFVVLCFVVVMQSFIMNSHEVFIYIHQGCFAGTGAIVRLPQCQWSKPDGYGKISQCITTTKHSKAKTVCIFLGIYCRYEHCWYWQKTSGNKSFSVSKTLPLFRPMCIRIVTQSYRKHVALLHKVCTSSTIRITITKLAHWRVYCVCGSQ